MPETATFTILGWRMRIFLVLSRWSEILQQPVFSTCSDNVAFGHSGRSISSLCSGFPEVSLQHQHVSGEKVWFNEYKAGPTKAPVKKSPNNCLRKKTTITKSKGVPVPMERIWAQLGFTASLCHHQLQCHQNHSGDQKFFLLLHFFWFSKVSGMLL